MNAAISQNIGHEFMVLQALIESNRWTYAVTLNTNMTFSGRETDCWSHRERLRRFQQRVEEKLIRKPQKLRLCERNIWIIQPALSPGKNLLHFHGVTVVPRGSSKTKLLTQIHSNWKKMYPGGNSATRILYDPHGWSDYASYGQSNVCGCWNPGHRSTDWMKDLIILPERR